MVDEQVKPQRVMATVQGLLAIWLAHCPSLMDLSTA